jgi:hypothetical protein
MPTVRLHQRQREIDAGADAGRRPYRLLADEDRVVVDVDGGEALAQQIAHRPMRGGPLAVQEAGLRQQEGAAADGGRAARPRRRNAQPVGQAGEPRVHARHVRRSWDDDGIGRIMDGKRLRRQRQSFRGADHAAAHAGGAAHVAGQAALAHEAARDPEHGLRTSQVEQADVVECQEQHQAGLWQEIRGIRRFIHTA